MNRLDLTPLLDELERRIQPDVEAKLMEDWRRFVFGRSEEPIFRPKRTRRGIPAAGAWPKVGVNDAIEDFDAMAAQQFRGCSDAIESGAGSFMAIRCNYGTGILPSLFGAELFMMDPALNTLPTTRPLAGGMAEVRRLVDAGIPDLRGALGGRVFEMAGRFQDLMKPYPKIRAHVHLFHPDVQGPMDVCELLWGSAMFLDMVDEPELTKAFLALITDTYIRFMDEWLKLVPPEDLAWSVHWGMLQRGQIMLRDDSAMNLSPAMFDEFIRPYDQRVLDHFGGGSIHFCGRGDHFIASMCGERGVHAIAMSQPELNDMETIYRATVDRGIHLTGFAGWAAEEALKRGRSLGGRVQCWS